MAIRINGDNTTAAPGITRGDDTDTGIQFGTDEVSIVTGGTERVKVDSGGKLLLEDAQQFQYNTASTDSRTWHLSNDVHGYGDFAFRRSTTQTGSTFETKILFKDSGGICFNGDTAAANALDDYEEGFFDPSLAATSGSATFSYNNGELGYVKIGRMVQITGRLQVKRTGTAGGTLQFQLPFAADNSMNVSGSPWMSHGSCFTHDIAYPGDASGSPFFWEINNPAIAGWFYLRNGSAWSAANPNLIPGGTNGYLTFTMTYRAAS